MLIAEAVDGRSGIELYRQHRPDVTLLDLQLPDLSGSEVLRIIRSEFPHARIIVLTTFKRDVPIAQALREGAAGFMLKDALRKELRDAIRAVHAGRRVLPPGVAHEFVEHLSDDTLSNREVEVLRTAARGNANKEIAAQLAITEDTVKAHMKSILSKLGAKDRTHAVVIAVRRGIIDV